MRRLRPRSVPLALCVVLAAAPVGAQVQITQVTPAFENAQPSGAANIRIDNGDPFQFVAFRGTDPREQEGSVVFWQNVPTPITLSPGSGAQAFALGTIYDNNVAGTASIASVDLRFTLGIQGLASPISEVFRFFRSSTPNQCTPLPICADDILTFGPPTIGSSFVVGGTTYFLNLVGFSIDGGRTFLQQLRSPEPTGSFGNQAEAVLYGEISTRSARETAQSTIPEPGTWALVGTGLAAMLAVRRRRAT